LSSAPRTATVTACRPSVVLAGSKGALDRVAAKAPEVGRVFAEFCRRRMLDNLVRTNFILKSASPSERPALIERFLVRQFNQGDRIIAQGSPPDGLHIVALGEVDVMHDDGQEPTLVAKLGPGEVVGEVALILRRPATTDVIAPQGVRGAVRAGRPPRPRNGQRRLRGGRRDRRLRPGLRRGRAAEPRGSGALERPGAAHP
jgi:CRP-like cAMP-binding protein